MIIKISSIIDYIIDSYSDTIEKLINVKMVLSLMQKVLLKKEEESTISLKDVESLPERSISFTTILNTERLD